MQPHDMAEQGLLAMPISSLINRVSGQMVSFALQFVVSFVVFTTRDTTETGPGSWCE